MSEFPLKSIGVVGGGVVGKATARTYLGWCEVKVWDMLSQRRTHILDEVLDCDLMFICLPSPQRNGKLECDTTIIDNVLADVANIKGKEVNLVLRSTVPIGHTKKLAERWGFTAIVHHPEFLTARCSLVDALTPSRHVIGSPLFAANGCCGQAAFHLKRILQARFPGVPVHEMHSDESELVKLGLNSFFAVKVAYFNELRCLADKLGLRWSTVLEGILSDGRIAHSHTQVPGPDGQRGFGGTCLPKDLANLATCMEDAGAKAAILLATMIRNNRIDRKEGDRG